jgi:uncharacterized membrane protein
MTADSKNLRAAVLLGVAGGLRTFTPSATLAARGRLPLSAQQRKLLIISAAGELIADKIPFAPSRTEPLPYLGRVTGGALCGTVVAGPAGALVGATTAAAATIVGYQCRRLATQHTRLRATVVALLEDAVAVTLANLGARSSG